MRAHVIESFGLEKLALVTRPSVPLGPHAVRVKVAAVSLNYRDLLMVKGQYDPRLRLPLVPLSDGVGVVAEVGLDHGPIGAAVDAHAAEERVAGVPSPFSCMASRNSSSSICLPALSMAPSSVASE